MKTYHCSPERFASDVSNHTMSVLHDDGVARHLYFSQPGRSAYWFAIHTWSGTLCIDGDCGTFVFRRIHDMFDFFRNDKAEINASYWAEKCVSANKLAVTSFEWDTFERNVKDYVEDEDDTVRAEVLAALAGVEQDEFGAVAFIRDFEHGGFHFQDWETDSREYTFHFIWCLRAIVWAIQRWDAALAQERAA